jgi:hypothetical protein
MRVSLGEDGGENTAPLGEIKENNGLELWFLARELTP